MGRSFYQVPGFRKAAIRENTLMSFITAGRLGADYVELDVQLSRDRECIVYHDFAVESALQDDGSTPSRHAGIDMGIHELTLSQLQVSMGWGRVGCEMQVEEHSGALWRA